MIEKFMLEIHRFLWKQRYIEISFSFTDIMVYVEFLFHY
jgi:hypothetical protein